MNKISTKTNYKTNYLEGGIDRVGDKKKLSCVLKLESRQNEVMVNTW